MLAGRENIVESIVPQINVMRDNVGIYKSMFGEEKYREKIAQLMNKLLGLGENNVGDGREAVDMPEVDLTLTSLVGDDDDRLVLILAGPIYCILNFFDSNSYM